MPIFTRPRRSRCYTRATQRDRSQLRAFDRGCRAPEPVTFVRETHGQVLRADVRRIQDVGFGERAAAVPFEAPRAPVTLPDRWPFPGSCTSLRRRVARVGLNHAEGIVTRSASDITRDLTLYGGAVVLGA
jgi:hypothetical protein